MMVTKDREILPVLTNMIKKKKKKKKTSYLEHSEDFWKKLCWSSSTLAT